MITETPDVASDAPETTRRAQPLSIDDRQAMIIDAVIPLLIEHGRSVTTRQIAEAAGIAEGTIFRAFGDKDSLITAAVARYLDPEPLQRALRSVDPTLPLERKIRDIVALMRERFGGVFKVMAAVGNWERPPGATQRHEFGQIIAELLEPERSALNWPADAVAHIIRLVTFASSIPQFNENSVMSDDELARMIVYGIAGTPRAEESDRN